MTITDNKYWDKIKYLIPNFLFETLLKYYYYYQNIKNKGNKYSCPICKGNFSKFLKENYTSDCPKCGAGSRHRALYLYLENKTSFFNSNLKLLHFAPEYCFHKRFDKMKNIEYFSADINSTRAKLNIDIRKIPFKNEIFDVVLSCYVLEVIDDDIMAMKELYRILKPDGWSIHNVPIDNSLNKSFENSEIKSYEDKIKYFGRWDHTRIYGLDYVERLKSVGFDVTVIKVSEFVEENAIKKYHLNKDEQMFLCKKL